MTGTRSEANKHRGMKDGLPWYPGDAQVTAQDALTFHRPPREYPPAVPSERLRIARSADAACACAHVGHPGADARRRRRRDAGLRARLPQHHVPLHRRGDDRPDARFLDRHPLVAEARRAQAGGGRGAPVRQVPARARGRARRGRRAPARGVRASVSGPRAPVDAARQAPERLGAPARPQGLPARAPGHGQRVARPRRRSRPGDEPARRVPGAVAAGGAQARRPKGDAARRGGRDRPRERRRPGRDRRPRARAGLDADADEPARRLAGAARPAHPQLPSQSDEADGVGVGQVAPAPARGPERARPVPDRALDGRPRRAAGGRAAAAPGAAAAASPRPTCAGEDVPLVAPELVVDDRRLPARPSRQRARPASASC